MEKNTQTYEPPTVTDAGDCTKVTLGHGGPFFDGGVPPYAYRPPD
ncbi:lasso RiPP family leader peptide-containing protein [Streptomyces chrestomyceticus]